MQNSDSVTGSCLCSKIQFTISAFERDVVMCHCQQCRKQSGHAYAASNVKNDNLHISGSDNIKWDEASDFAKRGFCKHCGSVLFWKANDSNTTSVMAGSLESPTGLTTKMHIFTEYKGDYYELNDGIPQHKLSD